MVNGITFNEQLITSADLAHAYWVFCGKKDGITKGCNVSKSGGNVSVTAGYMLSHGRLSKVTGTETISAPAYSGSTIYCRLVYHIDLSLTNTESVFNQGYFTILTSTTGYPSLTKEDLDGTGNVYEIPFAKFKVTSTGITNFTDERVRFDTMTEVSLTASGWSGSGPYTQTKSVSTVTSDSNPVQGIVYPSNCTESQRKAIQKSASKIVNIETGNGTVTFTASSLPSVNLTIGLSV